jgi:hypothetical protein
MKKALFSVLVIALMGFGIEEQKLTDAEREFAIAEMTKTHDHFMSALQGLSQEQLDFKSDDTSWSIAECAEHIALSEEMIYGMFQGALETTPDASRRSEVKTSDEALIAMIADRSQKVKTSEAFEPSSKFGSHEATVEAFSSKRKMHMDYVKTTEEDLRNRYQQLPFGTIDAFQVLLFMSGHTERHVLQMEEVKSNPNFPK